MMRYTTQFDTSKWRVLMGWHSRWFNPRHDHSNTGSTFLSFSTRLVASKVSQAYIAKEDGTFAMRCALGRTTE